METHFAVMGQNNEHSEVDKVLINGFKIRCKPIHRLNAVPIRNPAGFFVQMDRLIQMCVNIEGTRPPGTIWGMKEYAEAHTSLFQTSPWLQECRRVESAKCRLGDEWGALRARAEPSPSAQLVLGKRAKAGKWGENSLFHGWCRDKWLPTRRGMKPDLSLSLLRTEINAQCIKDPHAGAEAAKLSEETVAVNLPDPGLSNGFSDMTATAQQSRKKELNWTSLR